MALAVFAFLVAAPTVRPTARGATIEASVNALFAPWDKPDSPGCAVGVVKDGALVHARGYGMANLEHGVPITAATVFDIGSCSKQFTAFSILLLAQQGKLSLSDNLRKFVPEIPDYKRPISIRHLLYHTSGLRDYNDLLELDGKLIEDVTTEKDGLQLLAKQRGLNFPPGERHLYSNTGYFLLAVIVKRVTGQSLREFAQKNIFEPLGMTNTHFHDDHTLIVKGRATGYSPGSGRGFNIEMSNWEQLGDGALMTTVGDLLKWDRNFYDAKVGGQAVLAQMLTPGELNDGTKLNYACGLIIGTYQGLRMIHHGGAWAGYRAHMVRFPERKLSVFVLGNLSSLDAWNLAGRTDLLFLHGDNQSKTKQEVTPAPKAKPFSLSERELVKFTGTYTNSDGRIRHIQLTNDHLVLRARGGTRALTPIEEARFTIFDIPGKADIRFIVSPARNFRQMVIALDDEQPVIWTSVHPRTARLNLTEYAGTYGSKELNVLYVLSVVGETLMITAGNSSYPMTAEFADGFSSVSGATLEFKRDKRTRITGFILSTGRANGLLFERATLANRAQ